MSYKNKNTVNTIEVRSRRLAAQAGMVLMSAAALSGLIELTDLKTPKLAPMAQPSFAVVTEDGANRVEELMRREKEDHPHALVSFGETMRSHPTAGRP